MSKITKILAGVLLLAATLIGLYAFTLARKPAPLADPPGANQAVVVQHPIVVAAKPIVAGKPIAADSLRIEKLPFKPAGSFADTTSLVGKVAVADVGEGVPLLHNHLSGGLANQIVEGERAVAILIDEVVSVGYRVKPGDFVDVFVVLRMDNGEISPSLSRLLLPRARVLAMGANSVNEDAPKSGDAKAASRETAARSAVLAVPIADVNKLTLAQQTGKLTMALRNPKDDDLPAESLFESMPPAVQLVAHKPGATDRLTGKSLTKESAAEPINQAFAGTTLPGLSANKNPSLRGGGGGGGSPRTGGGSTQVTVEIIRAGVRENEKR